MTSLRHIVPVPVLVAAVVVAVAAGLAGCAWVPGRPGVEPVASAEEQALFDQARGQTEVDPDAGRRALTDFLDRYPKGPLADDAARMLADLALADGDSETAIHWLGYIVREHGSGNQADDALLLLARLEVEQGRPEEARRMLRRARFTRWPPEKQREAFQLLAQSAEDGVDRLYWLAAQREKERTLGLDDAVTVTDREIDALIATLSRDDLERAADQLDRRIPAGRVRVALARLALELGDVDQARDELERIGRIEMAPEYVSAQSELEREIALREQVHSIDGGLPSFEEVAALPAPSTDGARGTIGVVLPLTGDFAAYGEHCLQGILLAAGIFDEVGGLPVAPTAALPEDRSGPAAVDAAPPEQEFLGPRIRLVIRDSAGNPERAAAAVRALADDPDLVAIIGPLLSGASDAAAQVAQSLEVPLITLATRDEVATGRDWVFRVRTTPRDEVRAVLDHATREIGATRFAILYPSTRYGRGTRDQFWRGVEERGGSVVAVSSYDPEATDFAAPIRRLIGYPLLTDSEKRALKERSDALRRVRRLEPEEAAEARRVLMSQLGPEGQPLPPIVDFDVLFVPDSYENVVLIAPQLAFHEVTGVRLLGTGDWLHPELVRIARGHVRGAVIAAPFDPSSRFEFVHHFVERFTATFGREPDVFAAHAFDAANLALIQLAAGRSDRDELRDGVLATRGYPGVSGVLSFLPDGNAQKRPYLVGVRRSRFVSLD
ncbi:MAG: ABC transporter substrate-binding protein [Myxococcota bacterium]